MNIYVVGIDLLVNPPKPVYEVFLRGGEGSVILNILRIDFFQVIFRLNPLITP